MARFKVGDRAIIPRRYWMQGPVDYALIGTTGTVTKVTEEKYGATIRFSCSIRLDRKVGEWPPNLRFYQENLEFIPMEPDDEIMAMLDTIVMVSNG